MEPEGSLPCSQKPPIGLIGLLYLFIVYLSFYGILSLSVILIRSILMSSLEIINIRPHKLKYREENGDRIQ